MTQLHSMFNKFFEMHNNSRRRLLKLNVPIIIPVNPRMRLTKDHSSNKSLADIYNEDCLLKGMDPNYPIVTFRNTPIPQHTPNASQEEARKTSDLRREVRQLAFNNICRSLIKFI